jgi:hypothetical protein
MLTMACACAILAADGDWDNGDRVADAHQL